MKDEMSSHWPTESMQDVFWRKLFEIKSFIFLVITPFLLIRGRGVIVQHYLFSTATTDAAVTGACPSCLGTELTGRVL